MVKNSIFNFNGINSEPQLESTAKVVDGRLVLSLTDAIKPIVWQFDLSVAKQSAIELRETNGGETTLVLKNAKQDLQDIATYDTPQKAIKALTAIYKAMERAEGQMHAPQIGNYPLPMVIKQPSITSFKGLKNFLGALIKNVLMALLVLIILALLIIWFVPLSGDSQMPQAQMGGIEQPLETPLEAAPSVPAGEGVSADEFLGQ